MKKLYLSTIALSISVAGFVQPIETEAAQKFKDVSSSHFAYEAINWANNEGIISGYTDGTFKPNNMVTEAQFAKMLALYFNLSTAKGSIVKKADPKHWADDYYNQLASYSVPLNGYLSNTLRDENVKRGVVAEAIAYLAQDELTLEKSIQYLYDHQISTGQNPNEALIERHFGANNYLNRAQAVSFIHRLHLAGIDSLQGKQALMHYNSNENITSLAKLGTGYLSFHFAKADAYQDQDVYQAFQRERSDYYKRLKDSLDTAPFKIADSLKTSDHNLQIFNIEALDLLKSLLKPETIDYLNRHFSVFNASADNTYFNVMFSDKNNKGLHISYSPNDFYPKLYGNRSYSTVAAGDTLEINTAMAMVISDISGTARTVAEINSYQSWIAQKKNVTNEHGYPYGRTIRFGVKTYLSETYMNSPGYMFRYYPDKTRNEDLKD
ncbi:S-layer homology domain-containing protein [Lysinibacillus sp. NPDC047702]|uniref:S-layer homology domain-containing protein n=1 Tax=unclassified Lysinibacillus TaxID=2636778 RepID=UPI003CFEC371